MARKVIIDCDPGQDDAVAQQPALARLAQQTAQPPLEFAPTLGHVALAEEIDFLFREVNSSFDVQSQLDQLLGQCIDGA